MRASLLSVFIVGLAGLPQFGNAQVYQFETPPPAITAANSPWQPGGEPILHAGNYYYPAGPTVFFDGRVMVQVDTWFGVPLYEDSTLEPYSIVYLPIGGHQMRPYERRREGELAGTVGSRVPSFPVERHRQPALLAAADTMRVAPPSARDRSDSLTGRLNADARTPAPSSQDNTFVAHGAVTISPRDQTLDDRRPYNGLWIEIDGVRWYSGGPAQIYDADRFERSADYRGFPVYRERSGPADRIFVTTTMGGLLAPFDRR
jgi:hypothetical protein